MLVWHDIFSSWYLLPVRASVQVRQVIHGSLHIDSLIYILVQ